MSDEQWLEEVRLAVSNGTKAIEGGKELNAVIAHIISLLDSSCRLLKDGHFPTATFLAITALEETSKAHIGMYRNSAAAPKRSKDHLYSHKKKHYLAAAPTVSMGSRLGQAIGDERVQQLVDESRTGSFVQLRESCLYFSREKGVLQVPGDVVGFRLACEVLLFSIEAFDDALVGYTNESMVLSRKTDALFKLIASHLKRGHQT